MNTILLETLANLNQAYRDDSNAFVTIGPVNADPAANYAQLVRDLLDAFRSR